MKNSFSFDYSPTILSQPSPMPLDVTAAESSSGTHKVNKRKGRPHLSFHDKGSRNTEYRKVKALKEGVPQELLIKALSKE